MNNSGNVELMSYRNHQGNIVCPDCLSPDVDVLPSEIDRFDDKIELVSYIVCMNCGKETELVETLVTKSK